MLPSGSTRRTIESVNRSVERTSETLSPNSFLKRLLDLESGSDLQKALLGQIYESALLLEGLHPDPASMVSRLEQIMAAALEGSPEETGKE